MSCDSILVLQVLGILCMSLASPAYYGGSHFFLFVVVLAFIITTLWICIYLFSIREGLTLRIPWPLLVSLFTGVNTIKSNHDVFNKLEIQLNVSL